MSRQQIEELLRWLDAAPHLERCTHEYADALCSCGKKEVHEIAYMLLEEAEE